MLKDIKILLGNVYLAPGECEKSPGAPTLYKINGPNRPEKRKGLISNLFVLFCFCIIQENLQGGILTKKLFFLFLVKFLVNFWCGTGWFVKVCFLCVRRRRSRKLFYSTF